MYALAANARNPLPFRRSYLGLARLLFGAADLAFAKKLATAAVSLSARKDDLRSSRLKLPQNQFGISKTVTFFNLYEVGILESAGLSITSTLSMAMACKPPRSKRAPLAFTYLPT